MRRGDAPEPAQASSCGATRSSTSTTEVVDRIGLAATRVTDVATALDVSPALVFYHFGTKDALVAEAFAYAVERDLARLDKATAAGTDPVDRLRRALRSYGPTGPATGWRIWIDAWALAQREPAIRKVLRRMDQRWCAVLLDDHRGRASPTASFHCPDPDATVARISALLDGLSRGDAGLPHRHPRAAARLGGGDGRARARPRPGAARLSGGSVRESPHTSQWAGSRDRSGPGGPAGRP